MRREGLVAGGSPDAVALLGEHVDRTVFLGVGLVFFLLMMAVVLAVVVIAIIVVVQAYRAGRQGWWVYLIAMFISPLNLVAIIGWFAYWKKNPVMMNGKPFL